jgi:hypothetical protein
MSIQTFDVNSDHDLYLKPNGDMAVLSGLKAVIGGCKSVALSQLGEMVLTKNAGIPNFQTVWIGAPNYAIFRSYLRKNILNVKGVVDVPEVTTSSLDGVLSYTAKISTIFGTGIVNG